MQMAPCSADAIRAGVGKVHIDRPVRQDQLKFAYWPAFLVQPQDMKNPIWRSPGGPTSATRTDGNHKLKNHLSP